MCLLPGLLCSRPYAPCTLSSLIIRIHTRLLSTQTVFVPFFGFLTHIILSVFVYPITSNTGLEKGVFSKIYETVTEEYKKNTYSLEHASSLIIAVSATTIFYVLLVEAPHDFYSWES